MEVILLDKIDNLGDLGQKVKVRPGFARNYLFPTGRATMATRENERRFEEMRAELERKATEARQEAEQRREALEQLGGVTIEAREAQDGKLYGSVSAAEIAEAFTAAGASVAKKEVRLPTGPFRETGDYEIDLHLHSDVDARVTVSVVPAA